MVTRSSREGALPRRTRCFVEAPHDHACQSTPARLRATGRGGELLLPGDGDGWRVGTGTGCAPIERGGKEAQSEHDIHCPFGRPTEDMPVADRHDSNAYADRQRIV